MRYELEKSHSLVVPMKSANKTGLLVAESMEGSGGIARNAELHSTVRTLRRLSCVTGARPHTWGRNCGPRPTTRDKNRMREFRTYGSVRGVPSNGHPYRDPRPAPALLSMAAVPATPAVCRLRSTHRADPKTTFKNAHSRR